MSDYWQEVIRPRVEQDAQRWYKDDELQAEALLCSWLMWRKFGDTLDDDIIVWRSLKRAEQKGAGLEMGHRGHMDACDYALHAEGGLEVLARGKEWPPPHHLIAAETLAYLEAIPDATARRYLRACLRVVGFAEAASEARLHQNQARRMRRKLAARLRRRAVP